MHQKAADRELLEPAILQLATSRAFRKSDLIRIRALEIEFGGVLQDEDRTFGCLNAQGGCCKMPFQDLVFAHVLVREEPVGGLSIRPVLKSRRQRLPRALFKCFKHRSKSSVQPRVTQIGLGRFLVHPAMFHPGTSLSKGAGE